MLYNIRGHKYSTLDILDISWHFSKRTVSVLLTDPPCRDVNARLTTVPLKPLFNQ